MYDTDETVERPILVAVDKGDSPLSTDVHLDELSRLVDTAGGKEAGRMIQKRDAIHSAHYLGKGKLLELKDLISLVDATGIVCDDELTSTQQRNMERVLDVKIMDRTMVILDIFAGRASTAEGKVQVELAQLKYRLSHLGGVGKHLSRLGAGIGTRGPGEKKLETDRRYIKNRIVELNLEIKEIQTHREVMRDRRIKSQIPVVSIIGYTNAGKSTLMNLITGAGVLAEDKLFATLDTTTRKLELPSSGAGAKTDADPETGASGTTVLLTDTVGFIHKLPHNLVKAFKATLEELQHADILIHVVDASDPAREAQMDVVYKTINELNCGDKPVITAFNKLDKGYEKPLPTDKNAIKTIGISALENTGVNELLLAIGEVLNANRKQLEVLIPYNDGRILNEIHTNCEIISETHQEDGTRMVLYVDEKMLGRLEKFTFIYI